MDPGDSLKPTASHTLHKEAAPLCLLTFALSYTLPSLSFKDHSLLLLNLTLTSFKTLAKFCNCPSQNVCIYLYIPFIILLSQNKLECRKDKNLNIHNPPPWQWHTHCSLTDRQHGPVVSSIFPLALSIFSTCFSWFYLFNVLLCSLEVLTHCWKWNMDMKSL